MHPYWGRPLVHYYSSVYNSPPTLLEERKSLSLRAMVALRTRARSGIQKICDLGEARGGAPPGSTKLIPLKTLESISKLILLPKALSDLARPELVSGCIKLMTTVQESGRISPFSYEYGYLCFRVLAISMGVCLLEKSNRLNSVSSNMISEPLADPIMLLSKHVEHFIQSQAHAETQSPSGSENQEQRIGPHPEFAELLTLLQILYDDRKAFSIALMHTNSLGLAGVMRSLGQCLDQDARPTYNAVEMYCEVLWRYSNAACWDKVATQVLTNRYREEAKRTWKPTFVDLEDCATILHASEIALAIDDHRIPGPFDISAIPVLVGFATPFVELDSEDFLPPFLDATIGCMWNAIAGGQQSLDKLVDAVRDIFYHISKMLACVARQNSFDEPIHKLVIETCFKNDLFELAARLIMMISPRSANSYFFGDTHNLFSKLGKLIPREGLQDAFGDYFPGWLKYADYFFSCVSSLEFSKEDRDFFIEAVRCWNAIGVALGYDGNIILATLHHCGYARCPHPCITAATRYVCSQCGEKQYCGHKCQVADWINDHGEGSHRDLCPGSP